MLKTVIEFVAFQPEDIITASLASTVSPTRDNSIATTESFIIVNG